MAESLLVPVNRNICRLTLKYGQYHLAVPYDEKLPPQRENQARVVALDPGVRSFLSWYCADSVGKIGEGAFFRIQRLCERLDDLLSRSAKSPARKRWNMRRAAGRMRIRIENLIAELHRKAARFLVGNLYVVFDLQMCQFVGLVRGARRWTTGESGYRSGLHRIEVWHPSRRTCGSERIQGHEARICKCGAQRHDTHGGRTMVVVAGVDVSKATLEVSVSEGHVLSFENSAAGIRRLLRHMERMGVNKAVCESTGGYERLVVGKLREAAINVQVAHPLRVRAFAKACGYEAKTDPLDAQVLSRYGVVFSESDTAQPEVDPDREELRQLLSRRRQLVEQRVRERNRLDKGVSGSVGKSTRRHVRWLDKEIERLDEEYKELLKHSANLSETVELYQTVPGVGQLTAATLVAYLPELGRWDGKALTSLVGLAPWSRDSGKKRGSRSIRGGRSTVRRALYICAWVVLRVDGDLRDFYRRLRERGKPGKVAVIAVARKLLMQLNAVARRGTPWAKQHGSDYPSYQADSA